MTSPGGTIAEIDLGALCENYRLLSAESRAPCAAVVKANAYGLGVEPVAAALAQLGCREFFVATVEEGIALRPVLPDAAIAVLYGVATAEDAKLTVAHGLIPVLNSMEQLALWRDAAAGEGRALPAILHVDTGMSRLGLPLADAERIAEDAALLAGVDLRLVMSHLACSGTPDHPLNRQQLGRFRTVRQRFPKVRASFANSSGIFLGYDYHFDQTRPGAALYGINPTPDAANPMRTVVTVTSPILQIRTLTEAETVGYGATYQAPAGSRLATVGAGYADGLLRAMGNRAEAWVGGHKAPLAGVVSMDMAVLDISALPENDVRLGDRVEFFGAHMPVDVVAAKAGTIGYELLTSIGGRVKRIY